MKIIEGGVSSAKGFLASSASAGIKYTGRDDMALVYTKSPATYAGTFTTNIFKAAPVLWDKQILESDRLVHAVVLNSGIANACTGDEGMEINKYMASEVASLFELEAEDVLTASTGVIGMQMKKEPLHKGAALLKDALEASNEAGLSAAKAIMTTDTVPKQACVTFEVDGKTVTVGGMSKGSGMIHPNMATMLSVTTTDAAIAKEDLQEIVSEAVSDSFNMISVDRDTSTNDTYIVLANGEAGVEIKKGTKAYDDFKEAINFVATSLAKQMAADGEGASHMLEVTVTNAKTKAMAKVLAKSVITSPLVKSMIFGCDANCGRVLCSLGYSGEEFDPDKVSLYMKDGDEDFVIFKDGKYVSYSEEKATEILKKENVTFICDMNCGTESATAWGCDLTYDYVKINADYRS